MDGYGASYKVQSNMAENRCFSSVTYEPKIITSENLRRFLKDQGLYDGDVEKRIVSFDDVRKLSRHLEKCGKSIVVVHLMAAGHFR